MDKDGHLDLIVASNGKLRDTIRVSADISKDEAIELARKSERIQKWTEGKEVVKEIFVPGKLVNIVIK